MHGPGSPTPWEVTRATYSRRRYLVWVAPLWLLLALGTVGLVLHEEALSSICLVTAVLLNIFVTRRIRDELAAEAGRESGRDGRDRAAEDETR